MSAPILPANLPTDHAAAVKRVRDGISDSSLSTLRDIDGHKTRARPTPRAVAQMVVTDGGRTRIDPDGRLHLPFWPLRELAIGNHRLCPNAESDFHPFMDQACVTGSTAALIGPRHVLTAAHCVMVNNIVSHHFVFERTHHASHVQVDVEQRELIVDRSNYSTARSLVAYVKTPLVDWAVLELYEDVEHIEPLPVGRWNPALQADFVGHPLGLPLKVADIRPRKVAGGQAPNFLIDVDNGGGGSGSPIIQSGALVGVLRGAAGIDPQILVEAGAGRCVDPSRVSNPRPQPFTPASCFADCLSHLIGW